MRYSEVEQYGSRYRLLRLGNCDFEFDVSDVLFGSGSEEHMTSISDAILDVFSGAASTVFRVVLHPPAAGIFTSHVPAGMSDAGRRDHLSFESALLQAGDSSDPYVRIYPGRDFTSGAATESLPLQVAQIADTASKKVMTVLGRIEDADIELIASSEAVGRVVKALFPGSSETGMTTLALGVYDEHTEYTVMKDGKWLFGQEREETDPADTAYFSLLSLETAGVIGSSDTQIRLYGERILPDTSAVLQQFFPARVDLLNPISVVDLRADQFDDGFAFESFVPCLGAAL